jgi:hypothetical protein
MTARTAVMASVMAVMLAACGGSAEAPLPGADAGSGTGTGGGSGSDAGSGTGGAADAGSGSGADAGSGAADAGTGGSSAQPYKLSGLAVDTNGAPIAGAKVNVCNPLYWASCMHGATGADGRYSFDLPPANVWEVDTTIQKTFDGRNYCFDLKPDGTANFSSEAGAIRNFAWKISGLRPDATDPKAYTAYYGGMAWVMVGDFNREVPLAYVQLHFVPAGTVVDGSAAQAFTANAGDWAEFKIANIPIAPYTVTAEYAPPGAARSPLLLSTGSMTAPANSITLHFEPGAICSDSPTGSVSVYFP